MGERPGRGSLCSRPGGVCSLLLNYSHEQHVSPCTCTCVASLKGGPVWELSGSWPGVQITGVPPPNSYYCIYPAHKLHLSAPSLHPPAHKLHLSAPSCPHMCVFVLPALHHACLPCAPAGDSRVGQDPQVPAHTGLTRTPGTGGGGGPSCTKNKSWRDTHSALNYFLQFDTL